MGSLDGIVLGPDPGGRFLEDHSLKGGKCHPCTPAMVASRLRRDRIVPEVCRDFAPAADMRVSYGGATVVQGMRLPSKTTQLGRPHVALTGLQSGELYTLVFVHADERQRKAKCGAAAGPEGTGSEKLLWVVTDIPSSATEGTKELWEYGKEVVPYMGTDMHTEGTHRYVFLLFKQEYKTASIPSYPVKSRYGFSLRRFAILYSLGTPVAACYFLGSADGEKDEAAAPEAKCLWGGIPALSSF